MIPKTHQKYETIVVGAGPAGLIYLKDALILDKKREIGRPVQCGEAISKKALAMQGIKPEPLQNPLLRKEPKRILRFFRIRKKHRNYLW